MKGFAKHLFRLNAGRFVLALLGLVLVGWVLTGKAAKPAPEVLTTDWSHRHLVFSQPSKASLAARLAMQTRYLQQEFRLHAVRSVLDESDLAHHIPIPLPPGVHRDWSEDLGSGASVGAGIFPAKVSFRGSTANCASTSDPDFAVFGTGLLGSLGNATMVAYDNLYSGCSGIVPSVYWAYNTATPNTSQISTSPVFSQDGTQIAFVQTNGFINASLILLKWKSSTGETVSSPVAPTLVSSLNAYPGCSAPCMAEIPLMDGGGFQMADTNSSVFYDYDTDTAWVGDSETNLHKFNPVFKGTVTVPPGEVRDATWPLQLNAANRTQLSGPVHDLVSGMIFLGDLRGQGYRVDPTNGNVTISNQLDHGTGIVASPVVDSSAGKVYFFVTDDGGTGCGGGPCAGVVEFTTDFGTGATGVEVTVGNASTTNPLYDGIFDSTYDDSGNATGNLYVCGNTGGAPTLYKIAINTGTMSNAVAGPTLAGATTGCSPVSDISNINATGSVTEWVFASVQASGSGNNCSGGCIMNFGSEPWKASTAYTVGQQVVDTHFQIQTVRVAGTSGATTPGWSTGVAGNTIDNTVRWTNQGTQVAAHAAWAAINAYTRGMVIVDSNNNVEVVTTGGLSQLGTHPTWSTAVNGVTHDGTVTWHMVGAIATASLSAAGGTSGIIMDNTVGSGTLAGASQIYFSTQSNQACGTSGTGGCAVQASQSALQ